MTYYIYEGITSSQNKKSCNSNHNIYSHNLRDIEGTYRKYMLVYRETYIILIYMCVTYNIYTHTYNIYRLYIQQRQTHTEEHI